MRCSLDMHPLTILATRQLLSGMEGDGSKVAAPIARDLLLATQKRDPANREAPLDMHRKPKSEDLIGMRGFTYLPSG